MGQPGEMQQMRDGRVSSATEWGGVLEPANSPDTGPPAPTVSIGPGCSFEGLLTFRGTTQVDGQLSGESPRPLPPRTTSPAQPDRRGPSVPRKKGPAGDKPHTEPFRGHMKLHHTAALAIR